MIEYASTTAPSLRVRQMRSFMKQFVGRNEFRTRRLGHPKMRLDHLANPIARRRGPVQIRSDKSHGIYRRLQHDSRDYKNGQLSCVLLFSSIVISLKSVSITDFVFMVATCDF
jgi:hypothetical protein